LYIDKDITLQKQLEYVHPEVLVDTQWVEDHLNDPKVRIAEVDYDSISRIEIKKERIKKTRNIFFAIVIITALFAVSLITASQNASAAVVHHKVAVHHKAHTASKGKTSISVHHKVIAVIPEVHGRTLNATALKKLVKGPYGESDVIGGMIAGGY
jgi:hypothetical protein